MSFEAVLARLLASKPVKLSLDNVRALRSLLGCPDKAYKTVHVAGTNGKGSVATKIAACIRMSGFRVGLYTSPHISCFRERISVDGVLISEDQVAAGLGDVFAVCDANRILPTFFEATTMLAFKHFKHEKVDFAVVEVGLGGRLDATNIIEPDLCVITSISLDHSRILGSTIGEITREKAGIIKPKVPVVIGPKVPYDVTYEVARSLNSPLIRVGACDRSDDTDMENQMVASCAIEQLQQRFPSIQTFAEGLAAVPPCRFEKITGMRNGKPFTVILDVAHNPDGISRLFERLEKLQYGALHVIMGMSKDKDVVHAVRTARSMAHSLYIVEASDCKRAMPAMSVVELYQGRCSELDVSGPQPAVTCDGNVEKTLEHVLDVSEADDLIVAFGSFFIMDACRKALNVTAPRDKRPVKEDGI
ncbi:hypothetical protein PBRA_002196 [Plasmodiophora brassicae]|nr:hypothetical protein PBRA_002196 [Plasmodiophora brassicae]